ncbi:uncharacterized protein PFLUO_LOCUS5025 [Penicillium psychrofluorescens]|uniref:uncharacterized protein n=1 Tax=Penicillium psychrofluorescens TaxID=3158075 RepID=UPI003CCD6C41
MPPKRAAMRRGAGRTKASPSSPENFETLLDLSPGIPLPSVPTQAAFSYGTQGPTALPRRMRMAPRNMNLTQIARSIDAGVDAAQKRNPSPQKNSDQENIEPMDTRAGRSNGVSPVRRPRREPTPDQTQLLQSLRDVTATPPPPVAHTVSSESSPAIPPPQLRIQPDSPLYPSPLQRAGSPNYDVQMGSTPDRHSSVDNASEISFSLEREIHEDNLQRTRPSKYRGEPHGRNITAPPRRISGLALVGETIEEEDEPESEPADESEDVNEPSPYLAPEPEPEPEVETWSAPVRTVIPQTFRTEPVHPSPPSRSPKDGLIRPWLESMPPETRGDSEGQPVIHRTKWLMAVVTLLTCVLLVVLTTQNSLAEKIRSSLSFGEIPHMNFPPNLPESELVSSLRNQVSRMNVQVSSLSRELRSAVEPARSPSTTYISDPVVIPRQPIHKINFFSEALGAIVDPGSTTPTAGSKEPLLKRVFFSVFGLTSYLRGPLPPAAALTPWEELGDCWCSAPRNGVTQLSVHLGRDIVPEEVVVEHIPAGAALDPDVAPKEIELWARFRVVPLALHSKAPTESSSGWLPGWSSRQSRPSEPASSREEGLGGYNIPGEKSLHDVLMSSLRMHNIDEPESVYSDDPILGPNFYRVGQMVYDIHKRDHVQHFPLNVIVDVPTIRADKVVLRVKSSWGANNTCIYRVKLHGHV